MDGHDKPKIADEEEDDGHGEGHAPVHKDIRSPFGQAQSRPPGGADPPLQADQEKTEEHAGVIVVQKEDGETAIEGLSLIHI